MRANLFRKTMVLLRVRILVMKLKEKLRNKKTEFPGACLPHHKCLLLGGG